MRLRHGFTLVEMIVALSLTLIVTGAAYRLLSVTQRLSRIQAAQLNLQSSVRTAILVAVNELRGLNTVPAGTADQNDILSLTSSGITFRAARGTGFLCQAPSGTQLRIARSSFSGFRDPQVGDTAYVFLENDSETAEDDLWLPLPITAVSTSSTCSNGLGPAIAISTSATTWSPDVVFGTPVRIYELMELKAYQSQGQWWLGTRSVSSGEAIQPLAGPLAGPEGFRLEYLSRNSSSTADPTAVAGVRITLRGSSEELRREGSPAPVEEELTTQVALRNSSRP